VILEVVHDIFTQVNVLSVIVQVEFEVNDSEKSTWIKELSEIEILSVVEIKGFAKSSQLKSEKFWSVFQDQSLIFQFK